MNQQASSDLAIHDGWRFGARSDELKGQPPSAQAPRRFLAGVAQLGPYASQAGAVPPRKGRAPGLPDIRSPCPATFATSEPCLHEGAPGRGSPQSPRPFRELGPTLVEYCRQSCELVAVSVSLSADAPPL